METGGRDGPVVIDSTEGVDVPLGISVSFCLQGNGFGSKGQWVSYDLTLDPSMVTSFYTRINVVSSGDLRLILRRRAHSRRSYFSPPVWWDELLDSENVSEGLGSGKGGGQRQRIVSSLAELLYSLVNTHETT